MIENAAKLLTSLVTNDIAELYTERLCATMEKVVNYDGQIWLQKIIHCIEQLYSTGNKLLILPMSFQPNLLACSLSGSELIVNMIGKTRPAGSYSFMKKWLPNQAEEIKFPDGLVWCVFDNEQVVGKRQVAMTDNNTVPVSVITSNAYLEIDPQSEIQCQPELKPEASLFGETDVEPHFSYCCSVWGCCGVTEINQLQKLQNHAARIVTGSSFDTPGQPLIKRLG